MEPREARGAGRRADGAVRAGEPPRGFAHTRKQRESSGAGRARESGLGRGSQVSAEGGWASWPWQEQRRMLVQERGCGAVVICSCPGQVVAAA